MHASSRRSSDRARAMVFKLRGLVWAAGFLVAWLVARPTPPRILLMCALVLLGQTLRFWAAGHIPAYRGETLEGARLATSGPYAVVRNPLYVGNGLIGLGWSAPAGAIGLIFPFAFVLLYVLAIVPHEEAFLRQRFGDRYEAYCRATPAWLPARWPAAPPGAAPFNWGATWRAERHSVWPIALGTALIALKAW